MFNSLKFKQNGIFTRNAKRLSLTASAMSVLAFGFLANSLADPADTAYVPFKVNVAAHVSAVAQGESGVAATLNVTANKEDTLKIYIPAQSTKARSGLNGGPLMQNARGKVSLNLPAAGYKSADVALYTVNGRVVMRAKASASDAVRSVSRSNVGTGVYLLSVKGTNGNSFSGRVTHRGGPLNINVAFNGYASDKNVNADVKTFPYEITVEAVGLGHSDSVYTLDVTLGNNPLQVINLRTLPTYEITFDANGGDVTPASAQTGADGKLSSLPAPSKDGYDFSGWFTMATGGTVVDTDKVYDENTTIYARWTVINYTITYNLNGGTNHASNPASYTVETAITLGTPTKTGYTFDGWYENSSFSGSAVTSIPVGGTGNKEYWAYWISSNITYGSLTDTRDGKTYSTVEIDNQVWMAENLNYETAAGSYCYKDSLSYCDTYGRLYTWSAAMGLAETYNTTKWNGSDVNHKGVCPAGWHLPSNSEWGTLVNFVGSNAGTKLKSQTGWSFYSEETAGTDDFGFSALPGGYRYSGGGFYIAGGHGSWRSATEYDASSARSRDMYYLRSYVDEDWNDKSSGRSVRCLRD